MFKKTASAQKYIKKFQLCAITMAHLFIGICELKPPLFHSNLVVETEKERNSL
jgi:hypothetical protein